MFESVIDQIERNDRVSTVAAKLKSVAEPVVGDGLVRDVLTGRWFGHPAHPAIVIAPLAGWFAATLLDVVGGPSARRSAQRLVGFGTLAAMPAATTGIAEWLTTSKAEERVGTVHAALADGATVMYATSWVLRTRRHHRAAVGAALVGAALAGATAFMGGHLSFRRGVGVNTVAFQSGPQDWVALELDADASSDHAVRGVATGLPYAVVAAAPSGSAADAVPHVMESRCSHRGGPLHEGEVVDGCLECPWHGARFDLDTGEVRRGPASAPQPVYEVDDHDGRLSIRRTEHGSLRANVTTA
ncbi:MAG TPA: Rieske (2Fe-2S) protein [Ilumatobacteraceae bacterium]|nr:Rieske (2Fe-2S) protein [Ilumatobacteraceae bacterium]